MMLPSRTLAAALLATTSICWFPGASIAAPLGAPLGLTDANAPAVETVQWRGGYRGWGGRGWWGPGLAAGAIIGGALAASQPYGYGYGPGYYGYGPGYSSYGYDPGDYGYSYSTPGYAPGGDSVAYCAQRFRSYDPASGTYLGYDGLRHPCP